MKINSIILVLLFSICGLSQAHIHLQLNAICTLREIQSSLRLTPESDIYLKLSFAEQLEHRQKIDLLQKLSDWLSDEATIACKIKGLDLSGNNLECIPTDCFSHLPELTTLDLSRNAIAQVPADAFQKLQKLNKLYLQNNLIELDTDYYFNALVNLSELNISNNKITRIRYRLLANLPRLTKLDLSNNRSINWSSSSLPLSFVTRCQATTLKLSGVPKDFLSTLVPLKELVTNLLREQNIAEPDQHMAQIDSIIIDDQCKESDLRDAISAYASQQNLPHSCASNILYCGRHCWLTQAYYQSWRDFRYKRNQPLISPYNPSQNIVITLTVHSVHALLQKMFDDYDVDAVPKEDPDHYMLTNFDDLQQIAHHLAQRHHIPAFTEKVLNESCSDPLTMLFKLNALVELVKDKINPPTPHSYTTKEAARNMIATRLGPHKEKTVARLIAYAQKPKGIDTTLLEEAISIREKSMPKKGARCLFWRSCFK